MASSDSAYAWVSRYPLLASRWRRCALFVCVLAVGNASMIDLLLYVITVGQIRVNLA